MLPVSISLQTLLLVFFTLFVTHVRAQIIVKPATMFGAEDRFLNWIAEGLARLPYYLPLVDGGETLVQPVFAQDVAKAIMAIVDVSILVVCVCLLAVYA